LNLGYLIPRLARHFMPDGVARALLRRGMIIRPGLETSDPDAAAGRYRQILEQAGTSMDGKRVMVFGYGGSFALGCMLLRQGAGHVVLCDKFAPPDDARNALLLPEYADYLVDQGGGVQPLPEFITLLEADIRQVQQEMVDIILTSSVYEHLDDVEGITRALARLTRPGGMHLHYVDMRDHFFKYPFEMLAYSKRTWQSWLNPTSNLNRYRIPDYRRAFEQNFERVEIQVLASDPAAYEKVRRHIRAEFISGDLQVDTATLIRVMAFNPLLALE
jgi:SAM-dependent methyltransferase